MKNVHQFLTRFGIYRRTSRRQIRRVKSLFGCPDSWGNLIQILQEQPDAMYLDIGAHKGYTIQRISDECKNVIYGFEPTPDSFEYLCDRYRQHRNIQFQNVALSDKNGTGDFYLNSNEQTNSLLDNADGNTRFFPDATSHLKTTRIDLVRLDDWVASSLATSMSPLVVKCDVQGAEMKVIEGGRDTLKARCLAFYSEIQLVEMYVGQPKFSDIDSILTKELGFVLKDIYPCLHSPSGQALQFDVLWVKPLTLH